MRAELPLMMRAQSAGGGENGEAEHVEVASLGKESRGVGVGAGAGLNGTCRAAHLFARS